MINKRQLRRRATPKVVPAEDVALKSDDNLAVHVIDSDGRTLNEIAAVVRSLGYLVDAYEGVSELFARAPSDGVILLHQRASCELDQLLEQLSEQSVCLPVVVGSVNPKPEQVVAAIRRGALDYLGLPLKSDHLAATIRRVSRVAGASVEANHHLVEARRRIATLSRRERQVFEGVAEGSSNKVIARRLGISPRTVEIYRANMMEKLGVKHAGQVIRMALIASMGEPEQICGDATPIFMWSDPPETGPVN